MTINNRITVKQDSIWEGSNFSQFKVSKVEKKSDKIWIHYYLLTNTKQKYSCYEEAFISRFHELTNQS